MSSDAAIDGILEGGRMHLSVAKADFKFNAAHFVATKVRDARALRRNASPSLAVQERREKLHGHRYTTQVCRVRRVTRSWWPFTRERPHRWRFTGACTTTGTSWTLAW